MGSLDCRLDTDSGRSALAGYHPRPLLERRAVPDVLAVQAGQVGDPVALGVLVKAGDAAPHGSQFDRAGRSRAAIDVANPGR